MASNPYVNKVQLADGTTVLDISDTTAVASDVASGKYFYTASGQKVQGTATGGGGAIVVTTETDVGGGTITHITAVDISNDTVDASHLVSGYTAHDSTGTAITGNIPVKTQSDLTVSGATVTAPAGYYASNVSESVASGTAGTPTASKGTVSNHSVTVTPSVTNTTGYITGSTKTGTGVTVTASELASGNKNIVANGSNIDVVGYSTVSVAVPIVTYYTGSSAPSSALGVDGDIYLQTS